MEIPPYPPFRNYDIMGSTSFVLNRVFSIKDCSCNVPNSEHVSPFRLPVFTYIVQQQSIGTFVEKCWVFSVMKWVFTEHER